MPRSKRRPVLPEDPTQENLGGLPREWKGSGKYNRGDRIGKGAFATVYKVTSKFDGRPFAAKELDKRKFMKNGILDQKVENEMKIMQRAKHVSELILSFNMRSILIRIAEHRRIHRAFRLGQPTHDHHHGVCAKWGPRQSYLK